MNFLKKKTNLLYFLLRLSYIFSGHLKRAAGRLGDCGLTTCSKKPQFIFHAPFSTELHTNIFHLKCPPQGIFLKNLCLDRNYFEHFFFIFSKLLGSVRGGWGVVWVGDEVNLIQDFKNWRSFSERQNVLFVSRCIDVY